jgi:Domain of unknown function (DUF4271)
LKQVLFFLLLIVFPVLLQARLPQQDTLVLQKDAVGVKTSSIISSAIDSIPVKKDSILPPSALSSYNNVIQQALKENRFLKASGLPVAAVSRERPASSVTQIFYVLLAVVLLLGFLRFFYTRYFNNLFRVFFNTSLRQSQLTDQLLQAKQVSLFFNILFVITGGVYIYFLLAHFKWIAPARPLMVIGICILTLAGIYFLKYIVLKFTGWLTGYKEAANTYLFIIFLINKILSVLLIPFVIVIAFAAPFLQYPAVLVSLLLAGLMFLLRFLRSYGLLQNQVKVSRTHFFISILGVELIPLLLIYKALMVLLNKKL